MEQPSDRLLRLPAVLEKIQISRATLWRWVSEGSFPRPIKLGPKTTVWRESELSAYINKAGEQ